MPNIEFSCYSTKKTVGETVKWSKWSRKVKLEAPLSWARPGHTGDGTASSPFCSGHSCPVHHRVWELCSQHCLFKIQRPAQNPSWIPLRSSVCPHGQEQLCNRCTNRSESQAVKITWLWWRTWQCAHHNISWCQSDRFHTLRILILYLSCHRFINTEWAEKHEQTVTLGLIDISTFNYSSVNRLKITSAAISNGSVRSSGLLSNCLHLPAHPQLQNVIAFQVTSCFHPPFYQVWD